MDDKYFYTTTAQAALLQALNLIDSDGNALDGISTGCGGAYFQTPAFILLWVGKIPKTFDEDGNPLTYEADGAEHFNVRPLTGYPDFGALDSTVTEVVPNSPYSVFA